MHGLSKAAVKQVATAVGLYGSAGVSWMQANKQQDIPRNVLAMRDQMLQVADASWTAASEVRRAAIMARKPRRPEVTNMSFELTRLEREDVDVLTEALKSIGTDVFAWLGDCAYCNGGPGSAARVDACVSALAGQGVMVATKQIPSSSAEYMSWMQQYCAERGKVLLLTQPDPTLIRMYEQQHVFMAWLTKCGVQGAHGGRPHGPCAYGIA
eukprot:3081282-Karenia_brevis.AAC.1